MSASHRAQLQSKSTPNLPTLGSLGLLGPPGDAVEHPRASSPRSPPARGTAGVDGHEEEEGPFALEEEESGEEEEGEGEEGEEEEEEEGEEEEEEEEEKGEEEEVDSRPASRPLFTSRSYTHLPRQSASALYPPFYNRPPVPLPPSPSLTSLLRPAFSAATSRPTTPDSSDVEPNTPTSSTTNLAHMTHSARNAPTVPRASPKVPTYEYYGFAVYLGSSAAFLTYVLWASVPAPLLHQMGIAWYPDRWWALAVPCWLVALVVYIYVALASYNTRYLTLPLASCENLVDEAAQVAVVDRRTGLMARNPVSGAVGADTGSLSAYQFRADERPDWTGFWNVGTDAVMDVPIGGVCEILYGNDR